MVLGGLGATLNSIAKLEITPDAGGGTIKVPFNPNSYSITKSVNWASTKPSGTNQSEKASQRLLNAPEIEFAGGQSRILYFPELFFDATEPIDGQQYQDVRDITNKIVKLTRIIPDKKRPPICNVTWGNAPQGSDFPFTGVLTNLTQTFTLFKRDGTPVRAKLSLSFTEFLDPTKDQLETDPEMTTHIVKRGDALSRIAGQLYGNPKQWRLIANANNLDDPRRLQIGQSLSIPQPD
ncbi:MAG TPA: LysM peptidoglycan-binding domain-containing protein [Allocoleopsis sp.]